MKMMKWLFALLVGVGLSAVATPPAHALAGSATPAANAMAGTPQIEIQWREPAEPQGNWSDAWHRGFHAGARAAHHDIQAGRPPDPNRHREFKHPDARGDQRHDFREGFRHGYRMVYDRDWRH